MTQAQLAIIRMHGNAGDLAHILLDETIERRAGQDCLHRRLPATWTARQRAPSQAFSSSRFAQRRSVASRQIWRRRSWTFFSTMPFSQPLATLQNSGSKR